MANLSKILLSLFLGEFIYSKFIANKRLMYKHRSVNYRMQ